MMGESLVKPENQAFAENANIGGITASTFDLIQRMAKLFAASTLVPQSFQGNVPNCYIALNMAARMKADPMMVMQNMYIVHGNPGWSSKFLIATFNACGRYSSIRYEWEGEKGKDNYGCYAEATENSSGKVLKGTTITIQIAKDEGWYGKTGSKWKTMPEQMLMYRAAAWFIRVYAPEISMGLQTQEEIEDVHDLRRNRDGSYSIVENGNGNISTVENSGKSKLASIIPTVVKPEVIEVQDEPARPKTNKKESDFIPFDVPDVSLVFVSEMKQRAAEAQSMTELSNINAEAESARQAGEITSEQAGEITKACTVRRKALGVK